MKISISTIGQDSQEFDLDKSSITIGRSKDADISLSIEGISRKHMQIDLQDDQLYITDLNSSNGVYINEERIEAGKKVEYHTFLPLQICGTTTITIEL